MSDQKKKTPEKKEAPKAPAPKSENKYKVLKPIAGYAYFVGNVVQLPKELAEEFLSHKFIEEV
jgi:hypothetical protein